MSIVEFPVEDEKDLVIVDIGGHVLGLGPGRSLEELFGQLGEAVLVHVVDLVHVTLGNHVLEVLQELLDLQFHW